MAKLDLNFLLISHKKHVMVDLASMYDLNCVIFARFYNHQVLYSVFEP